MIRIFEHYKPSVATPQHCPDINKVCAWIPNTRYCARCFLDSAGNLPPLIMSLSTAQRDMLLAKLEEEGAWPLAFSVVPLCKSFYDIFGVTAEMRRKAEIFLADESAGLYSVVPERAVKERFIPDRDVCGYV